MGRTRQFDTAEVIDSAAQVFRRHGYEASSLDHLVEASGIHRGSLYKAFGSKRGLFLDALRQSATSSGTVDLALDLTLFALLELAPTDDEVRTAAADVLAGLAIDNPAATLGAHLLARANLHHLSERTT